MSFKSPIALFTRTCQGSRVMLRRSVIETSQETKAYSLKLMRR